MTNADVFHSQFGIYATELWAMPEKEFLDWLNSEYRIKTEIDHTEKVIKGLECCSNGKEKPSWLEKTERNCEKCPYNLPGVACTRAMAYDALSLLKAQEPEKPIHKQIVNEHEKYTEYINRSFCAKCGAEFIHRVNYCPRCGKAVKWDD